MVSRKLCFSSLVGIFIGYLNCLGTKNRGLSLVGACLYSLERKIEGLSLGGTCLYWKSIWMSVINPN